MNTGATKPSSTPSRRTATASKDALQELGDWIEHGMLPEVTPTRQARSLRTTLAMLEAGRLLLMDRPLEELSVEIVCQKAGTAVGAFYGRFSNKQSFFVTMQRILSLNSEAALKEFARRHVSTETTLEEVCRGIVLYTVGVFRTNLGVLRASLQHTREGMFAIHETASERNRPIFRESLVHKLSHLPLRTRILRIDFAYQSMVGTLVHTVLNDPGPLSLADDELIDELTLQMRVYLAASKLP